MSPSGGNGDKWTLRRRAAADKITRRSQAVPLYFDIPRDFCHNKKQKAGAAHEALYRRPGPGDHQQPVHPF